MPTSYEIARLRRDLRVQLRHLQNLVEADLDCTIAALTVAHTQGKLLDLLDETESAAARVA